MPLNDEAFEQEIITIHDEVRTVTDYEESRQLYARKLATAVKNYLKSGTIEISGTSNQGPFTGTGVIS